MAVLVWATGGGGVPLSVESSRAHPHGNHGPRGGWAYRCDKCDMIVSLQQGKGAQRRARLISTV